MPAYDPIPTITPDCRGRYAYNTIVPGWIVTHLQSGKPLVMDPLTEKCARQALAYAEATKPENVIQRGLPEKYVALKKEWDDPARRSALLARMASMSPRKLKDFFSEHMDEEDNIRLWLGRFKAYIDAVEALTMHNVIDKPTKAGASDLFYATF